VRPGLHLHLAFSYTSSTLERQVRELRILPNILAALLLSVCIFSTNRAVASPANTRVDSWGTVELAGSNWLDGHGVTVYSNGAKSEGPTPDTYNYIDNKHGVLTRTGIKWQCVELINRLYLSRGWISEWWPGNGNQVFALAPSNLVKEANGGITYLNPGDVVAFDDGGFGHAGIVSSVSGDTVQIVNQNTVSVYSLATLSNRTLTMNEVGWSGYRVQGVVHAPLWNGVGDAVYKGDTLASGSTLRMNEYLASANVQYALMLQSDGNLVMYGEGRPVWQSETSGKGGNRVVMQTDGNLVMYRADGAPIWWSGTHGNPGMYANLQSDGNFVIRSASVAVWSTQTGGHPNLSYFGSDRLKAGQQLIHNQYLRSSDGRYALLLKPDGNVVLYGPGYHLLWQTNTTGAGDQLIMQTDGNLVLYAISNPQWWRGSTDAPDARVVLQDDGNLVLYDHDNFPLWHSKTDGEL
jgi:hypothetical protein